VYVCMCTYSDVALWPNFRYVYVDFNVVMMTKNYTCVATVVLLIVRPQLASLTSHHSYRDSSFQTSFIPKSSDRLPWLQTYS
jgi:hypothetical protein